MHRKKELVTNYCIRYENNGSKRWDGKELLVDKDWVDELYVDVYPGKRIQLPWTGKKGKTVMWNAVVIENTHQPSPKKQQLEDKKPAKQKQSKKPTKKEKGNCMCDYFSFS